MKARLNPSLLDELAAIDRGLLATVVETEGETYKKAGDKALFEPDHPIPRWGNIGTGCFDQAIVRRGREVLEAEAPEIVEFDLSDPSDIHFGSGTFCGGHFEILLEPVGPAQSETYAGIRAAMEEGDGERYLVHDLVDGTLEVHSSEPDEDPNRLVERLVPLQPLVLFGATPLARQLVTVTDGLPMATTVVDWRETYRKHFRQTVSRSVEVTEAFEADGEAFVLVLSHRFARDREVLREALERESPYIGMLSSESRRDRMFEDLVDRGIERAALDTVHAPVGLSIGARSDREIAISIAAEMVRRLSTGSLGN